MRVRLLLSRAAVCIFFACGYTILVPFAIRGLFGIPLAFHVEWGINFFLGAMLLVCFYEFGTLEVKKG